MFETENSGKPLGIFECNLIENYIQILNSDYDEIERVECLDDVAGKKPLSFHINSSEN